MSHGTDDSDTVDGPEQCPDGDERWNRAHPPHLDRYDLIRFSDEQTIIYDSRNELAWIQSEVAIDLEAHA